MPTPKVISKQAAPKTLTFGVNVSAFPALSGNATAAALLKACDDAFSWGAKQPSGANVENPPGLPGQWGFFEQELIKAASLAGQFTANGIVLLGLPPDQYANSYGIALAQGLEDFRAGRSENKTYTVQGTWPPDVAASFQAIYTAAYAVYQPPESQGNEDQGGSSGAGVVVAVVVVTAAAAGIWYWFTRRRLHK